MALSLRMTVEQAMALHLARLTMRPRLHVVTALGAGIRSRDLFLRSVSGGRRDLATAAVSSRNAHADSGTRLSRRDNSRTRTDDRPRRSFRRRSEDEAAFTRKSIRRREDDDSNYQARKSFRRREDEDSEDEAAFKSPRRRQDKDAAFARKSFRRREDEDSEDEADSKGRSSRKLLRVKRVKEWKEHQQFEVHADYLRSRYAFARKNALRRKTEESSNDRKEETKKTVGSRVDSEPTASKEKVEKTKKTIGSRVDREPTASEENVAPKKKRQPKPSIKDVEPISDFSPFSTTGFESLNLSEKIIKKLQELNLTKPTEIQASAIPVLLEGRDAAMQCFTGSGKTLAYLLPILSRFGPLADKTEKPRRPGDIQVVIAAPSRELAMQIVREAEKLLGEVNRPLVQQLIGGANMKRQAEALKKKKPLIIVGTPGRISEFSRAGKLRTHNCRVLVFDEADQLLSLKYRNDMKRILEHVGLRRGGGDGDEWRHDDRENRQTILVSATMPPAVLRAAQEWGDKPLLLKANSAAKVEDVDATTEVGSEGEQSQKKKKESDIRGAKESLPPNLSHYYIFCESRRRVSTLRKCIFALDAQTVLVFMNFTHRLKDTVFKLQAGNIEAGCLHGEKGKLARSTTLNAFRNQNLRVLVVSEVGARGIDIPECDLVVNLELPTDSTHYAHRAGRTGRLGRPGKVLNICSPSEKFVLEKFEKQLGIDMHKCEVSFGDVKLDEIVDGAGEVEDADEDEGSK